MKYTILSLIFLLAALNSFAQFSIAMIEDVDEYTNVRKDSSINAPILWQLKESDVFYYNGDSWFYKKDWIPIFLYDKDKSCFTPSGKKGFIHRSRIKPIENIEIFQNNLKLNNNSLNFSNDSIQVQIEIKEISKSETKSYPKGCYYGTDGPPSEIDNTITNLKVKINGKDITIPKEAIKNLFNANLEQTLIKYYNDTLIIAMANSNGAGYYCVVWTFSNYNYLKRYIYLGP